eukprot:3873351-Rhodomonas_salina.1
MHEADTVLDALASASPGNNQCGGVMRCNVVVCDWMQCESVMLCGVKERGRGAVQTLMRALH